MSLKDQMFKSVPTLDWLVNSVFALGAALMVMSFASGGASVVPVWLAFGLLVGLQLGDPAGALRGRIAPRRFTARFCLGLSVAALVHVVHAVMATGTLDKKTILILLPLLLIPLFLGMPIKRDG